MSCPIEKMRSALIMSNVQLTPSHDSSIYSGDVIKGKQTYTVKGVKTNALATSKEVVKGWHCDIHTSINNGTLTDVERMWVTYAYAHNRRKKYAKRMCTTLLIEYNSRYKSKKSSTKIVDRMLLLAIYAASSELVLGKHVLNMHNIAEAIGVKYEAYRKTWNDRYELIISLIKRIDSNALKSLAQCHQNAHYMKNEFSF